MRKALAIASLLVAAPAHAQTAGDAAARGLYGRLCLPCHGERGDGQGPAALLFDPPPRDFTSGAFRLRSTPAGSPPILDDLVRTIARGVPGTSMPAFAGTLTTEQLRAVALRVLALSPARPPAPPVRMPPPVLAGELARGRAAWERAGCPSCHGLAGAGDGPAAAGLRRDDGRPAPPHDLRTTPFRGGSGIGDLVRVVATGMEGTPMPAYRDSLGDQELVDLAVFLRSLQDRALLAAVAPGGEVPALGDGADRVVRELPDVPDGDLRGYHRFPIPRQGPAPPGLTPAEASLDPRQCGRCHAAELRGWSRSRHALTHGPGFRGQMHIHPTELRSAEDPGSAEARFEYGCHRCHAPMTEQLPRIEVEGTFVPNPDEVAGLADTGVGCAVCHLRGHVRHGPPPARGTRLPLPSYPLRVVGKLERGDFCLPCHQHSMEDAVAGRPPLDTYREWVASPYFRRGVQCQSCHMPDREHRFLGVHDPATVRQGLSFVASLRREGGTAVVTVRLRNVAAGHRLPTTATPTILVHGLLVDARGAPVPGSERVLDVVRRDLFYADGRWQERSDTRIAPGETRVSEARWPRAAGAVAARIEVEVRPDHDYEGIYRVLMRRAGGGPGLAELRQAYARTLASPYVLYGRDLPLGD